MMSSMKTLSDQAKQYQYYNLSLCLNIQHTAHSASPPSHCAVLALLGEIIRVSSEDTQDIGIGRLQQLGDKQIERYIPPEVYIVPFVGVRPVGLEEALPLQGDQK